MTSFPFLLCAYVQTTEAAKSANSVEYGIRKVIETDVIDGKELAVRYNDGSVLVYAVADLLGLPSQRFEHLEDPDFAVLRQTPSIAKART